MRIVVTNLGKIEINDDESNIIPEINISGQKNKLKKLSISYNKPKKDFALLKGSQTSRKTISISKIRNNPFPLLKQIPKNIFISDKIDKNNKTFLPKIKDTLSPNKSISLIKNINQQNNTKKIFKKAIKVSQKKLNIPNNMIDKYSKDTKEILKDIFKKDNEKEEIVVNNTEENLFFERNKVYTLRDILVPKNKKNVDSSFLDKKIDMNGGQSIINYLHKDKPISPIYIQKVSQMKNFELNKMDKICQKYLNDEIKKNKLDYEIRKKIKNGYEIEAIKYEKDLKNMNNNLKNYNNIYQKLRLKKENYDNYKLMYLSTIK